MFARGSSPRVYFSIKSLLACSRWCLHLGTLEAQGVAPFHTFPVTKLTAGPVRISQRPEGFIEGLVANWGLFGR